MFDFVAADEDVLRRRELGRLAVEDADVFEEGDVVGRCRVLGGRVLGGGRDREREECEERERESERATHGVVSAGLEKVGFLSTARKRRSAGSDCIRRAPAGHAESRASRNYHAKPTVSEVPSTRWSNSKGLSTSDQF